MKRILLNVIAIIVLISIYSNSIVIAESKEKYYNVQIPIFQGTTEKFSTELLNGITTAKEEEKGIIFVSIEDFKRLSNIEIVKKANSTVTLKRNTVYLELQIDNENALLSLGYSENNVIKSFKVKVPSIKYKNNIYISLTHGLNSFGIEMNIINEENIINIISINEKVLDEKCINESTSYLKNNGIFDFSKYPKYLHISSSEPFDKFFLEYYNENIKYIFSWESLSILNNVTASLGSIPSNFISNYEGLSDFILGEYEVEQRYYDILCTIINNESTKESPIDISHVYQTINLLSDSGAIENIINSSPAFSFTISSIADSMKAAEKTVNLFRCSEFQKNVLDKTILISDKLKQEMIDDKFVTDMVNMSLFNKYNNNNYLTSLYNNQYALYKSADKLNSDIDNPIKNVSYDMYKDLIYKALTSMGDYALDSVTGGATEIPDLLMNNIKYNNVINDLILAPSETVGQVKDCYFIQNIAKSMCDLNIFYETENSYYNFRLILQSSLTAYELLSNNEALLNIIGEQGKKLITEKITNINSILSDVEKCDISFYSTNNISDEIEKVKEISIMIVPIEEETQSPEFVEITEVPTEPITTTSPEPVTTMAENEPEEMQTTNPIDTSENKYKPEDTIRKMERALNNLDMEELIECYEPQVQKMYNEIFKFDENLMGMDIGSLLGGFTNIYGNEFGLEMPEITINIDNQEYISSEQVKMGLTIHYQNSTMSDEAVDINLIQIDDIWYISSEMSLW